MERDDKIRNMLEKKVYLDKDTLEIKKMFAVALNKKVEEINGNADFFLDESGTSLDYFVIINKVNEEYGVNLANSEKPLNTPKEIANYIKENLWLPYSTGLLR